MTIETKNKILTAACKFQIPIRLRITFITKSYRVTQFCPDYIQGQGYIWLNNGDDRFSHSIEINDSFWTKRLIGLIV